MRKISIYILGIIFCLIIADVCLGICCKYYIKNHKLTGRYLPLDRLIKEIDTDIILIGNSAILNSLDPQIIEDTLSMSCYNGGIIGQGVVFFETIVDCILQRHKPQIIVLGLRPEEVGGQIGEGIFDVLKPYYGMGYKSIDDHFNKTDKTDRLLLHSNLIRYNTIWVRVLLYILYDKTNYPENGFMPKELPASFPKLIKIEKAEFPVVKQLNCIEHIIKKCKSNNICLFVCFPPNLFAFKEETIPCVKAVNDLCSRYNTPCFIDYNNEEFLKRPELFYDNGHVNKKGAKVYSNYISNKIKSYYSMNK